MNKLFLVISILSSLSVFSVYASNCPDPETSSLKWGVPPEPWVENPFSANPPQGEDNTIFHHANIMVAGVMGRGIVCAYKNSIGIYSIWWPVTVKVPAPQDYDWIDTIGGFICTHSLEACQFSVAVE